MDDHSISQVPDFIDRWNQSGGAERANYQLFLAELCDCLAVPRPNLTTDDDSRNACVFERSVRFDNRDGTHSVCGKFCVAAEFRYNGPAYRPEPTLSSTGE